MSVLRKRAGFTIIELLAVISILGILGSVITPLIGQGLTRYRLDQFSRSLVTGIRTASFNSQEAPIQVRYNLDLEEVRFRQWTGRGPADLTSTTNWARPRNMDVITAPGGVDIRSVGAQTNGIACQVFRPDGTAMRPVATGDASCSPGGAAQLPGIVIRGRNIDDVCNNHSIWVYLQAGKAELFDYQIQGLPGVGDLGVVDLAQPPECT